MTREETNNLTEIPADKFNKLSIQVSLNGLSFCIADTIRKTVISAEHLGFGKELSPFEVHRELKEMLRNRDIPLSSVNEVSVVHRNNIFSLVPRALFKEEELPNYLKFNTKILANDYIAYDELNSLEMVNVYVPFMNINNYIFEHFGEFIYKHNGTVLLESLMNTMENRAESICYVCVGLNQMDVVIFSEKRVLFYNSFHFRTREDFIYYILFTLEQLKLDPAELKVRLFGDVEEGDEIYNLCYQYIQHLSIFVPDYQYNTDELHDSAKTDFILLSSL